MSSIAENNEELRRVWTITSERCDDKRGARTPRPSTMQELIAFGIVRRCEDAAKKVMQSSINMELHQLEHGYNNCNTDTLQEHTRHIFYKSIYCEFCDDFGIHNSTQLFSHFFKDTHKEKVSQFNELNKESVAFWKEEISRSGWPHNLDASSCSQAIPTHAQAVVTKEMALTEERMRDDSPISESYGEMHSSAERMSTSPASEHDQEDYCEPQDIPLVDTVDPLAIIRPCAALDNLKRWKGIKTKMDQLKQNSACCDESELEQRTQHIFIKPVPCDIPACNSFESNSAKDLLQHFFRKIHRKQIYLCDINSASLTYWVGITAECTLDPARVAAYELQREQREDLQRNKEAAENLQRNMLLDIRMAGEELAVLEERRVDPLRILQNIGTRNEGVRWIDLKPLKKSYEWCDKPRLSRHLLTTPVRCEMAACNNFKMSNAQELIRHFLSRKHRRGIRISEVDLPSVAYWTRIATGCIPNLQKRLADYDENHRKSAKSRAITENNEEAGGVWEEAIAVADEPVVPDVADEAIQPQAVDQHVTDWPAPNPLLSALIKFALLVLLNWALPFLELPLLLAVLIGPFWLSWKQFRDTTFFDRSFKKIRRTCWKHFGAIDQAVEAANEKYARPEIGVCVEYVLCLLIAVALVRVIPDVIALFENVSWDVVPSVDVVQSAVTDHLSSIIENPVKSLHESALLYILYSMRTVNDDKA